MARSLGRRHRIFLFTILLISITTNAAFAERKGGFKKFMKNMIAPPTEEEVFEEKVMLIFMFIKLKIHKFLKN